MELYKKHRPQALAEIVGQRKPVQILKTFEAQGRFPNALLLSGPSGTGKTTIARIIARRLGCDMDVGLKEVNAADLRGIDDVRDIRAALWQRPLKGSCKVYILDEAHQLTKAAQNALLKLLEDGPKHVYFILATTDPTGIIRTVRTRTTEILLGNLSGADIVALLDRVAEKEGFQLDANVANRIAHLSEGSAREALQVLNSLVGVPADQQMDSLMKASAKDGSFALVRMLFSPKTNWEAMAVRLREIEKEDLEVVRRSVLTYAHKMITSPGARGKGRLYYIIVAFSDPFSHIAELTGACYSVLFNPHKTED